MHRIDHATKDVDLFGSGKHGFTEGTPGTEAATVVTDDWFNGVQEEICNTVEATQVLVKGTRDQLLSSLGTMLTDHALSNWQAQSAVGANNFIASATDGDIVCLLHATGIEWSRDGVTWTAVAVGASNQGIAYGNGYWCIVGQGATDTYYAADPTGSWTANDQGISTFTDVHYANGYWCIVGSTSGTLYYRATDPTGSFTANAQGSSGFSVVKYAGGYWVAAGTAGNLYYKATDPTGSWTSNSQGSTNLHGLAYGSLYGTDTWVATGISGVVYTKATDPSGSWTLASGTGSDNLWTPVIENGMLAIAGDIYSGFQGVLTSVDGENFAVRMLDTGNDLNTIVYAFRGFICGGDSGEIQTSGRIGSLWD